MSINVTVLRPLLYRGERREAGEVLSVPPADAWQLCSGGRAELQDAKRDGPAVKAAVERDTAAAIKAEGRPWQHAELQEPWQRRVG